MKKVESPTSAAMVVKSFFEKEWPGFVFDEKGKLIRTTIIPTGPAWLVAAERGKDRVVFVWETVEKYAYPCHVQFAYDSVIPSVEKPEVIKDNNGMTGTIVSHNGETSIIWE